MDFSPQLTSHSLVYIYFHPSTYPFMHTSYLFIYSLIHLLIHVPIHPLAIHSFTHSLNHSLTYLLTHLLTHSLINKYVMLSLFQFAKKFYIAQWIRDAQIEKERAMRNPSDLPSDIMDGLNTSIPLGADSIQKSEEVIQKLHEIMDDRITNIR